MSPDLSRKHFIVFFERFLEDFIRLFSYHGFLPCSNSPRPPSTHAASRTGLHADMTPRLRSVSCAPAPFRPHDSETPSSLPPNRGTMNESHAQSRRSPCAL